jgi:hypothetical protein
MSRLPQKIAVSRSSGSEKAEISYFPTTHDIRHAYPSNNGCAQDDPAAVRHRGEHCSESRSEQWKTHHWPSRRHTHPRRSPSWYQSPPHKWTDRTRAATLQFYKLWASIFFGCFTAQLQLRCGRHATKATSQRNCRSKRRPVGYGPRLT